MIKSFEQEVEEAWQSKMKQLARNKALEELREQIEADEKKVREQEERERKKKKVSLIIFFSIFY
jgi:uncharacterized protein YukE